jgi:hypothetical protein
MSRRSRHSLRASLAVALVLALASIGQATKPTPPVVLSARLVKADPTAGTASIVIEAKSILAASSLRIRCELPPGSAMVPGTGEWGGDENRKTLSVTVTLPPQSGKIIVRADLIGERLRTGAVAGLALPSKAGEEPPQPAGKVIKTNTGERLRIHK